EPERSTVDADGAVHVPGFVVPLSRYMSAPAKRLFIEESKGSRIASALRARTGGDPNASIEVMRAGINDYFRPIAEHAKALYPVNIKELKMGGVMTQVV